MNYTRVIRLAAASFRRRLSAIAYILSGITVGIALVVSCSAGPPQSQAQTSGAGAAAAAGSAGGQSAGSASNAGNGGGSGGLSCSPGAFFCDGNALWQCTHSGKDGSNPTDCTLEGSSTNPANCTTACPVGDAGACCVRSQPVCTWSVTAPFAAAGTESIVGTCAPPTAALCPGQGSFVVALIETSCSPSIIELMIARATVSPGTVTLPNAGVTLLAGGCIQWTGTVGWTEAPAWSVTVNAMCSTPGSSVAVKGTLSGQL